MCSEATGSLMVGVVDLDRSIGHSCVGQSVTRVLVNRSLGCWSIGQIVLPLNCALNQAPKNDT